MGKRNGARRSTEVRAFSRGSFVSTAKVAALKVVTRVCSLSLSLALVVTRPARAFVASRASSFSLYGSAMHRYDDALQRGARGGSVNGLRGVMREMLLVVYGPISWDFMGWENFGFMDFWNFCRRALSLDLGVL